MGVVNVSFGGQIIIANVSLMLNATALDGTVHDSLVCWHKNISLYIKLKDNLI